MTQEEKAKLYDELKVKAQELAEDGYIDKLALVDMFPELKESKEEGIRKLLISFVKYDMPDNYSDDFSKEDCLAWLEKQCEKGTNGNNMEIPNSEQNPADKVEPKFKAGDWVVYKGDICQIVKREEGRNKLVTVFGTEKEPVNERNLSTARLWNIKDAKDGDVLADKFGVILFRKIGNEKYADAVDYYCAVFKSGGFIIQKGVSYWGLSKEEELRPTTLEQRVRFFDMMGDAGYAWDAEKKELKKIEQKPVKRIDIDRAIDAFRRVCPHSIELKHLDGTTEPYECFGSKCKEHSYRCNYICKSLRRFIDILKEPEQ